MFTTTWWEYYLIQGASESIFNNYDIYKKASKMSRKSEVGEETCKNIWER